MSATSPGDLVGYFRVFIDGQNFTTISVNNASSTYQITTSLDPSTSHTVEVYNMIEAALARPQPFDTNPPYLAIQINSITVDGTLLAPPPEPERKLVVVGDSITCGFGAGGTGTNDCPNPTIYAEDNSVTYGNLLCQNFSASCSIISFSGKGLYVNSPTAGTNETLPSYYQQTLVVEQYNFDFKFGNVSAVIINLGTNDFGHNHDTGKAWETNFTNTYVEFMQNLTVWHQNPNLPIFCASGPLTQKPLPTIQAAIDQFNAMGGNAHLLDQDISKVGQSVNGCYGHPSGANHRAMFEMAQPVIAAVMNW
jgi:lysophospholipase L1-like esterase